MKTTNNVPYRVTILYSLLILLLIPNSGFAQRTETIGGVTHIINEGSGKWSQNPRVKLELVAELGKIGSTDNENYMFYLPADIAADGKGNLYVLDAGNYKIKKFDLDGKFIFSFGEKGQGPGEFFAPSAIALDTKDNIYILDKGNKRFEVFNANGIKIKTASAETNPKLFYINSKGEFITGSIPRHAAMRAAGEYLADKSKTYEPPLIVVYNLEGERAEPLRNIGRQQDYGDPITTNFMHANSFALDSQDNVIVNYRIRNRIEKYASDGTLLLSIERPVNIELSDDKKAEIGGQSQLIEIGIPKLNLLSNTVAVDARGRIWVATLNRKPTSEEQRFGLSGLVFDAMPGGPQLELAGPDASAEKVPELNPKTDAFVLEIFSRAGELLGQINPGHYVHKLKFIDDKLYILDTHNAMQFYVYKVIE